MMLQGALLKLAVFGEQLTHDAAHPPGYVSDCGIGLFASRAVTLVDAPEIGRVRY